MTNADTQIIGLLTQIEAAGGGGGGGGGTPNDGSVTDAKLSLTTPNLATPSAIVLTNASGTAASLTAGHVTTNANLTGDVTSVGNATTLANIPAIAGTNLTGTAANLTAGTASAVAVGGITGLGTGVATALAVNVGSAGAPVTFNGALGTPSGGTVTNLTGTASININGTVGATTPGTGAFTTLTNTGAAVNSVSGAASTPALKVSGVPFAGTGTTSFPLVYINDANATASTTLSTAGTYLGVNGDGTQDLMNLMKDGVTMLKVTSTGDLQVADGANSKNIKFGTGDDAFIYSRNSISIRAGASVFSTRSTIFLASDNTVGGTVGVNLKANSDGVGQLVNQASTAPASLIQKRATADKTSDYPVVALDSNAFFTNAGAVGTVIFTLPTAAAGLTYTFYVAAASTLEVLAGASTTIQVAGSVSGSAGNITNATVGGCITLVAISTTKWVSQSHEGTWTVT